MYYHCIVMVTLAANKGRLSSKWCSPLGGLLFHKVQIAPELILFCYLPCSPVLWTAPLPAPSLHHPQVIVFKDEKWWLQFLASVVDPAMPMEAEDLSPLPLFALVGSFLKRPFS